MKLSILDLSIVPKNGDRTQALRNTLDLAQHADQLGFNRIWLAEHHGAGTGAGRSPEVMIPYIASQTNNIRVGSGAILLNHYSPYKVAELFNSLEELFPGRIDMGIGRATTGPISDMALQRKRSVYSDSTNDSAQQLIELQHWMNQDFEEGNPFSEIESYNNGTSPEFWLLGSSPWSADAASQLGLSYAFAGFINPAMSYPITKMYRDNFKASTHENGIEKPKLMLALNVFAAETPEEAYRMTAPFQLFEFRLRNHADIHSLLEDEDQAIKILGGLKPAEQFINPHQPPRILAGTPEQLKDWMTQIAAAYGTDEIMMQTVTGNHEARKKSNALLAEVFELKNNNTTQENPSYNWN